MAEQDAHEAHGAGGFDINTLLEQAKKFIKDSGGPAAGLLHLLEGLTPEQKSAVEKQYHALGDRKLLSSMSDEELSEILGGMSPEELRIEYCACAIDGMLKTRERGEEHGRHIEWVQQAWASPREWK